MHFNIYELFLSQFSYQNFSVSIVSISGVKLLKIYK